MPEITDELFLAAVRTFYARRFPTGDRTDDLLRLDAEVYVEDFRDALAMAFAAGRQSVHGKAEATTIYGIRCTNEAHLNYGFVYQEGRTRAGLEQYVEVSQSRCWQLVSREKWTDAPWTEVA